MIFIMACVISVWAIMCGLVYTISQYLDMVNDKELR